MVAVGGLVVMGIGDSRGGVVGCGSGCGHWSCLSQCLV